MPQQQSGFGLLQATSMVDTASLMLPVAVDCQQVVSAMQAGSLHKGKKYDGFMKNIFDCDLEGYPGHSAEGKGPRGDLRGHGIKRNIQSDGQC